MSASPAEEEEYIKGIQDVIGRVPCFGGSAADNTVEGNWSLFYNEEVFSDGVVVAFFYTSKEITTISDFSRFADMTRETDKIEVEFDNYSGYPFYFTIEDQEDIEEIMNIIFSASFTKMGTEPNGGDHTSITIIQGEKEYKMHAFMNKEGQYFAH